jgi:hypothetical protein
MCPPLSRVTACIAILLAVVTACGPATFRSGRDRDRLLRTTRVGPQRIDALEGAHGHDELDGRRLPAAQVTDQAAGRERSGPTPMAPVATLQTGYTPLGRPHLCGSVGSQPAQAHQRAALDAHAPDRAPPFA